MIEPAFLLHLKAQLKLENCPNLYCLLKSFAVKLLVRKHVSSIMFSCFECTAVDSALCGSYVDSRSQF